MDPMQCKVCMFGKLTPGGTGVMQIYEVQHGEVQLVKEIEKAKPLKCGTFWCHFSAAKAYGHWGL
uniref:Uncharacterized protein n=1 Tax=Anguilla anguilla TaxID=7936 RepID=A0A0E9P8X8_ANGAN